MPLLLCDNHLQGVYMRDLIEYLVQPRHLLVFAIVAFMFFGAIGILDSGPKSGSRRDR